MNATTPKVSDRIRWAMAAPAVLLAGAFGFLMHEVQTSQNRTNGSGVGTDPASFQQTGGFRGDDSSGESDDSGQQVFVPPQGGGNGGQFNGGQSFNGGGQSFGQIGPGGSGPGMGGTSGS
jgi:hypothetical protein